MEKNTFFSQIFSALFSLCLWYHLISVLYLDQSWWVRWLELLLLHPEQSKGWQKGEVSTAGQSYDLWHHSNFPVGNMMTVLIKHISTKCNHDKLTAEMQTLISEEFQKHFHCNSLHNAGWAMFVSNTRESRKIFLFQELFMVHVYKLVNS